MNAEEVRAGSRIDRLTRPRARDVVTETAVEFGVCVRPVLLRRTDLETGETLVVEVPCGSTREAACPPCADRARRLRAQQCREGWHLTEEPTLVAHPGSEEQRELIRERAAATEALDHALDHAGDTGDARDGEGTGSAGELAVTVGDLDAALAATGARGAVVPAVTRRKRSTRRRDDVPDLPRRPATASTLGRTFTDPGSGRTFRPSLFVTLTLPSYGRVHGDGSAVDPGRYDYRRAARDALHVGKLLDRWHQNLRRVAGYDVQYFAAVEPQRRGAPHAHYAIRGTLPRALVRELTAATYVNVWWPDTDTVIYGGQHLPVWDEQSAGYRDPVTGEPLLTWEEALDSIGDDDPPRHTVRFGTQVDVKGVLAGSPEAERAIGYLVKYLVKDLGDDLNDEQDDDADQDDDASDGRDVRRAASTRRADHLARLVEELRYEPCSPGCANWLRYGIQPKNPRSGMRPGCCRAKAHRPSHLGYGGRRVLVSRKWTAKDLRDHRHDRRDHVRAVLEAAGITPDDDVNDSATGPGTVSWELAKPTDPDVPPRHHRLLRAIAEAHRRRTQYRAARDSPGASAAQNGHQDQTEGGTAA